MWRPSGGFGKTIVVLAKAGTQWRSSKDTEFPLSCQMSGNDDMEHLALTR